MDEKDIYDKLMKSINSITAYNKTMIPPKDFENIDIERMKREGLL